MVKLGLCTDYLLSSRLASQIEVSCLQGLVRTCPSQPLTFVSGFKDLAHHSDQTKDGHDEYGPFSEHVLGILVLGNQLRVLVNISVLS